MSGKITGSILSSGGTIKGQATNAQPVTGGVAASAAVSGNVARDAGLSGSVAHEAALQGDLQGESAMAGNMAAAYGTPGRDGKDGYTPIKGIDYFDGKDGYTPIKGVDYFDGKDGLPGKDGIDGKDGKDGYTPIKGVDYFDGKDGQDGKNGIDGKDGYTPVKGVDYFDGQPGEKGEKGDKGDPGIQGEQGIPGEKGEKGDKGDTGEPGADGQPGKDGKDGYTPVKGVDYFDGEPGADGQDGSPGADGQPGKDGQNGVSPIIAVADIEGGHRITVTDASGTKTIDVLDGEDGKTPVKGTDYFTVADKGEIVSQVLAGLPTGTVSNAVTLTTEQTVTGVKTFTASNFFDGEQKLTFGQYCPTVTDIASGIGASMKNARAVDCQLYVAEVYAPYWASGVTHGGKEPTSGLTASVGQIDFYVITGAAGGQPTGRKLIMQMKEDGLYVLGKKVKTE